jgi:hypothetical protein
MKVSSETVVRAECGHATLIVGFDGTSGASRLVIDEHDNGLILGIISTKMMLDRLCAALDGRREIEAGARVSLQLTAPMPSSQSDASIVTDGEGFELTIRNQGERERTVRFSRDDGAMLSKAIRGSFGFWG